MTLTHDEARAALHAAADGLLAPEARTALDAHLEACADCRNYAASLTALEGRLSTSLQARWPDQKMDTSVAASIIGQISTPNRRPTMQSNSTSLVRPLVFGVIAIVIVLAIGLGIRAFWPQSAPVVSNITPSGTIPSSPLSTMMPPAPLLPISTETPLPVPTDAPFSYTVVAGDTCAYIASLFKVPEESIITFNNLTTDCIISVGQTLLIPSFALTPMPPALSTPAPSGPLAQPFGMFPNLTIALATALPDAPAQVTVYRQQISESVTAETAQQAAANLGINGIPTQTESEGYDQTIFEVSDGVALLRFMNFADQWVYDPLDDVIHAITGDLMSFEQQVAIAEDFLNARGLLNFPYRSEPIETTPGGVRFVRLLDGRPVIYGYGINGGFAWIEVTINADGQVGWVTHSAHDFQPVGDYPILTAQQAWERLADENAFSHSTFAIYPHEQTPQTWERNYPLDQETEFYGFINHSYENGQLVFNPWGLPAEWPVSGNIQGLEVQIPTDQGSVSVTHIWGQLSETSGERTLVVTRWEPLQADGAYYYGEIQQQDGQNWLAADDGQRFLLPDLPESLPDGALVNVLGVVVPGDVPTFEWTSIDTLVSSYGTSITCFGGGGGGGFGPSNANFGGGSFAMLNLFPDTATATPTVIAGLVQSGETLEGVTGTVYITIYTRNGVELRRDVNFWVDPGASTSAYLSYLLEGEALADIETYQNQPIKVWGQVSRIAENGTPVISVDRFEQAYPGQTIQAWIGTEEVVTLEGQTAILFTTQDGVQFILKHTIGGDASYLVGRPGDTIIQEGLLTSETFGGYPVFIDMAASWGDGVDLSSYEITSNQPAVVDEAYMSEDSPSVDSLQGMATVESIELAYMAVSLDNCTPAANETPLEAGLYVQPMWVFKGHFEDGRRFEIRIQALPEAYLSQ